MWYPGSRQPGMRLLLPPLRSFIKCGIHVSDTDLQATSEISQELRTLATVAAGLPYDENVEMENLQPCDDLEGGLISGRLQR